MTPIQTAAVTVAYAARHADRVSRLILHGGYSRGFRKRKSSEEIPTREALATLIRNRGTKDTPTFRQVFTSLVFPNATQQQMHEFKELQRL